MKRQRGAGGRGSVPGVERADPSADLADAGRADAELVDAQPDE